MNNTDLFKMERELETARFSWQDEPIKLSEEVEKIIEDDDDGSDCACGQKCLPPDEVQEAIEKKIAHLVESGYYDDDAQEAVFDALAHLIENELLEDTPDYNASKDDKMKWVQSFETKVHGRLVAMGIDLEG